MLDWFIELQNVLEPLFFLRKTYPTVAVLAGICDKQGIVSTYPSKVHILIW